MTTKQALLAAVKKAGGQASFSKALGVRQSLVWYWIERSKRGVPGERVLDVERLTGVSRHELRPDLYPQEARAS